MEIKNGVLEVMQGEQFTETITGINYNACSQIILLLYREPERDNKNYFLKEESGDYPGAGLIIYNGDDNELQVDITKELSESLPLGTYFMEAVRVIAGINQPVMKNKKPFFVLVKSEV